MQPALARWQTMLSDADRSVRKVEECAVHVHSTARELKPQGLFMLFIYSILHAIGDRPKQEWECTQSLQWQSLNLTV